MNKKKIHFISIKIFKISYCESFSHGLLIYNYQVQDQPFSVRGFSCQVYLEVIFKMFFTFTCLFWIFFSLFPYHLHHFVKLNDTANEGVPLSLRLRLDRVCQRGRGFHNCNWLLPDYTYSECPTGRADHAFPSRRLVCSYF